MHGKMGLWETWLADYKTRGWRYFFHSKLMHNKSAPISKQESYFIYFSLLMGGKDKYGINGLITYHSRWASLNEFFFLVQVWNPFCMGVGSVASDRSVGRSLYL